MEKGRGGNCCGPLGWLVGFRLDMMSTHWVLCCSRKLPQQGSERFCKGFPQVVRLLVVRPLLFLSIFAALVSFVFAPTHFSPRVLLETLGLLYV